jgi:hypothetical protein
VVEGLEVRAHQTRGAQRLKHLVGDCAPDNVSDRLLRIILTHTDFVNRVVWRKPDAARVVRETVQG